MRLLVERVEAMKAIWTAEAAECHGRFVHFDPIWSWPKPLQQPHPPILVGGSGPKVLERVLAVGDGWMPIRIADLDELARRIAELHEMADAAGRGRMSVTLFGAPRRPDKLERLAGMGVERALLLVPPAAPGDVLRALDEDAKLLERMPA
jgi:hypothetical protein